MLLLIKACLFSIKYIRSAAPFRLPESAGYLSGKWLPEQTHREGCKHNAHMYYIKVKDLETRSRLITYLKENGICTAFHYVPLHSSPAGRKFGRFSGEDVYTTRESERLLRLPMFYNLEMPDVEYITEKILSFEF